MQVTVRDDYRVNNERNCTLTARSGGAHPLRR